MGEKNKKISEYIVNISSRMNEQYNGIMNDEKIQRAIDMFSNSDLPYEEIIEQINKLASQVIKRYIEEKEKRFNPELVKENHKEIYDKLEILIKKLNLDTLEETLFVPMRGRVFCSRTFPDTFKDEKALEIAKELPEEYMNLERETEYTLMASAIRSKNMDIYIKKFLSKNPNGTIINVGCGMETTFYRNDNGKCIFIEMDLEEVTSMREKVFGKNKRDIILTKSLLDYSWIEDVKKIAKGPYLIIASGVFYYFPKDQIIEFLRKVKLLGTVEILFDTVSKSGMKRTKKYMKQLGKEDATMYFYVEKGKKLINEIGNNCKLIDEHDFYDFTENKSKFKFKTKLYMVISDKLHMVKMIQLKYGDE